MNQSNGSTVAGQLEIERTALRLLQRPEIKQAYEEARQLFLADPLAGTEGGRETLEQAVTEMALNLIYEAILSDLSTPRLFWFASPPHSWFGHNVGGARFWLDNPDGFCRSAIIDPQGSYEIRARRVGPEPVDFSLQFYPDGRYGAVLPGVPLRSSKAGSTTESQQLDQAFGGLFDHEIQKAEDGSFTITISPESANGRVNHIQPQGGATTLFIRTVLADWEVESPHWMEISRLDPAPPAMPDEILAAQAIELLKQDMPFTLSFINLGIYSKTTNTLPVPRSRGGNWGFSCMSNFDLADDEGLLVSIHPQGARYTGFEVATPWGVSHDYIHRTGGLNNAQTRPNADGSFTYVVAAKDPGLANWLDTNGMQTGALMLRWQAFAQQPDTADGLVREVKPIKLAELQKLAPDRSLWLTQGERKQELIKRAKAYDRRLSQYLKA